MSRQLHVGNQQFFRQYAPDSELPLEKRIFTTEYEALSRQTGSGVQPADFVSPMDFNISMNNEMYFLRSLHLRLPVTARFYDDFGNCARSPEEVACLAVRNRPDRCFQKIEANLNGFRSTRNPDDMSWNEYLQTDDEYGLNLPNDGIGVPISTVQLSSAPQAGRQQVKSIASAPVSVSVPSEENPNYAARARLFSDSWNYDDARWEGDITIPVEVGPHRPYSTKKSIRSKFIPYIGTEQLRFEWKNYKSEFDYKGSKVDQTAIAKYLFEQSTRLHQSARDAPIARQVGETDPFTLWFSEDRVFMIVPHDGTCVFGQTPTGFKSHADVCARFTPGSTVEFDSLGFQTTAHRDERAFRANWVTQPYKVFRVQDCTLGAVGGRYGRTGAQSAATNVASTTGEGSGTAKYAMYANQLRVRGFGNVDRLNSTYDQGDDIQNNAYPNTFHPTGAGNVPPPRALTYQVGRALCESSSVVIFTKDSFTALNKQKQDGAVMATMAGAGGAVTYFNRSAHTQAFYQQTSPSALMCVRRYKTAAEATASGVTDMPEELYGQTIAVELARGVHQALFGKARYAFGMGPGVSTRSALIATGGAALQAICDTIFQGRFEALEGQLPPSMTVENGAIVEMTNANICLSGDVGANQGIAGRWDTFEVMKFIAAGNAGDPDATKRIQLTSGMNTDNLAYNANLYNTAYITTALMPYGEALLVPNSNKITAPRIGPTHSKGRYKYVLSTSGTTSLSVANSLGTRVASEIVSDVEASSCYAYNTGVVNDKQRYETRVPSGVVPINRVEMTWRGQGPHLLCEWAVLKRVEPVYSLYYPQYEKFVDDEFRNDENLTVQFGNIYRYGMFPLPGPFEEVKRSIQGIRINEVPSLIVIRAELAEADRNRFDWMDVRAWISNIRFKLNERVDLTSNVPDVVGYRWFLENTKSLMTYEEWKSNCLWIVSPQQLAVDPNNFVESLAKVNTIGVECTIKRPKPYKNSSMQYREADFWPGYGSTAAGKSVAPNYARSYTTPRFQLKMNFMFDNHSLIMNNRREVLLRKNVLQGTGPSGLVRDDRGLPKQGGLLAGPSAPSSGRGISYKQGAIHNPTIGAATVHTSYPAQPF